MPICSTFIPLDNARLVRILQRRRIPVRLETLIGFVGQRARMAQQNPGRAPCAKNLAPNSSVAMPSDTASIATRSGLMPVSPSITIARR